MSGSTLDLLAHLTPATQLMVERRLELGDLEGADFLMKTESADTRRKYELWKMKEGLLECKSPEWKNGPSRLGMDELEAEMKEPRKNLSKMLYEASGKQSEKEDVYVSTIHINVPLTVLIPDEQFKKVSTASAVLGLRSEYY